MKGIAFGHRLRNRWKRQRGAALLELALIVTALSILVVGAADFGRIAYMAMALTHAARAGAMTGSQSASDSNNFTAMQNAASASASADIGTIVATASRSCECDVGGVVTVMGSCPPGGVCAGIVRIRVSVTASDTFKLVRPFMRLPTNVVISRTAVMRAQ